MADIQKLPFGFRERVTVSPEPVWDASSLKFDARLSGAMLGLLLALTAATPAPAVEDVLDPPLALGPAEQAYTAFQRGDFETARILWKQAAIKGDASAQYNLGLIFAEGRGVIRNPGAAISWWQLAAQSGHHQAQHNLALAYISGETIIPGVAEKPRIDEAIILLRKAAQGGLASSRYALGTLLLVRADNDTQKREAVDLLASAADQGQVEAQFFLGNYFFDGNGVQIDRREALALFLKSAAAGHAPAQDRIAALYQSGDFVPADKVEALAWANLASRSGLASAVDRQRALREEMSEADIKAATVRASELIQD